MTMKTGKEVFHTLLSNVWHGNERTTKIYEEMAQAAQDPQIKSALDARAFVSNKVRDTLSECFKQLGMKPLPANTQLHDVFLEDFRREIGEIQSPIARRVFVLAKVSHLIHLRIGQYLALVAAADLSGNYGVGVLLESCLADKYAFAERTRHLIRRIAEEKGAERMAA